MSFQTKIYVVQKYDRQGNPGEVIALKLTFSAAHAIAKANAPASVGFSIADKSLTLNKPEYY